MRKISERVETHLKKAGRALQLGGQTGPQLVRNLEHYQRLFWSDFKTLS